MNIDEQTMIEEAIWDASTHINTAYGLMVDFWESYLMYTNDTSLVNDMEHRRYIVEAKVNAILDAVVTAKNELDVYMNPESTQLEAIFRSADNKRKLIEELQHNAQTSESVINTRK